jgi:hypothetical protein
MVRIRAIVANESRNDMDFFTNIFNAAGVQVHHIYLLTSDIFNEPIIIGCVTYTGVTGWFKFFPSSVKKRLDLITGYDRSPYIQESLIYRVTNYVLNSAACYCDGCEDMIDIIIYEDIEETRLLREREPFIICSNCVHIFDHEHTSEHTIVRVEVDTEDVCDICFESAYNNAHKCDECSNYHSICGKCYEFIPIGLKSNGEYDPRILNFKLLTIQEIYIHLDNRGMYSDYNWRNILLPFLS